MKHILITLLLTMSMLARAAEPLQGGYSIEPLRDPLFDEAAVVVETTAINNWLAANIQKLNYEQMKGPREHLYYLIDSRVKQIYTTEKRVLPAKNDPILEILFSWSEYLGVFGGAQAFNTVKAPSSAAKNPGMKLPEGIDLKLAGDVFTIRSSHGWSITIPYYFMVWNVGDFTAKNGPRTQLIAISTGASKDKSKAGRSQATLMLLFSPDKYDIFDRYWREQMGIGAEVQLAVLGVKNLKSRHIFDKSAQLHKEFTSWSNETGSFAVAYLGIDGTYEWNRAHFIDFLRTIKTHE